MFEKKVESYLRRRRISIKNKGILVGVSGGPDSLALLHYLWSQKDKWNLQVVAAHVDHMFRGLESQQEALFVKNFCEERRIPLELKQINVRNYMKTRGISSEEVAGRECRYAFFEEVLVKHDLPLLALGHHGDDQVETILMRLTRGSTGKARAGIPFSRDFGNGVLFRPFLCLNREEIEKYCSFHQLNPRRDPSNEKDIYSRNRFRKVVLPFLRKENPQVHEHFQRFSEDVESDENFLQELTAKTVESAIKKRTSETISIDIEAFLLMPLPLQRRGIQLILKYLYKEKPTVLSAVHIDQIFSIMKKNHPSGKLDFPNGLRIFRSYSDITFSFSVPALHSPFSIDLIEPGDLLLPNGDIIMMEYVDKELKNLNKNAFVIYIDEDHLPLMIRTRRNGDRMTIKGMTGTKKIKDIFIDEKVPLHMRDSWPIVTDRFGEILWIPGIKKANLSVDDPTKNQRHILLTYKSQ